MRRKWQRNEGTDFFGLVCYELFGTGPDIAQYANGNRRLFLHPVCFTLAILNPVGSAGIGYLLPIGIL